MSAANLTAANLHGRIKWRDTHIRLGIDAKHLTGKGAPCPKCGGVDRFCYADKGRGVWSCRKCDGANPGKGAAGGNGYDLLMRVHGWDFTQAFQEVKRVNGIAEGEALARMAVTPPREEEDAPKLRWSPKAQAIWDRARPLAGRIGAYYLTEVRACKLPPEDGDLRFLPGSDKYPPSLCARVTDAKTCQPLTLHFTRLKSDGSGKLYSREEEEADPTGRTRSRSLLGGHRAAGGVIRLWPDEAVTYGVGLAEGIESALSAAHVFAPMWAAVSSGNLGAFPVLAGIDALTVFADHDEPGLEAAEAVREHWLDAGREVRVRRSPIDGEDAADIARRLRDIVARPDRWTDEQGREHWIDEHGQENIRDADGRIGVVF